MERLTYTYALIKSLYDQGEDYIDAFCPFITKVLSPERQFVTVEFIQDRLEENFGISIPVHPLRTILSRMENKDYIEEHDRKCALTENGRKSLDAVETEREVERRLNELISDIKIFLAESYNLSVNPEDIYDSLLFLIQKNLDIFIEFCCPAVSCRVLPKSKDFTKYLIEYVEILEDRKKEYYNTMRDMVLGSIISLSLSCEEISEISKKFKGCEVFLDTNFLFSLLELHFPEFSKPAKEIYELLKMHGFKFSVFSFTVDEICRVVNGYLGTGRRYPSSIRVDSIYSRLKNLGWDKTSVRDFVTNIENLLLDSDITIKHVDVDLNTYNPPRDNWRDLIVKYKPSQPIGSQNHDPAAVEKTREIQKKPVRKIEEAKAFFLSSDVGLSRFDFIEMGHKENGTVGEVILDRLLTTILWLKNPSTEISLNSIIAAYSRELFVKRSIWERFYENLQQLKLQNKINDENITTLFYHGYIEDTLRDIDAVKIDEDFVLEEIEKASKFIEEQEKIRIREKEREFLQRLEEELSKKEIEKENE